MNFKKIVLALLVIVFALNSQAQKSVYSVSYESNWGLTDSIGTEIVAPTYDRYEVSKDGKLYVFKPEWSLSARENVLLYNTETGEINNNYDYFYLDHVMINEQSYHYFDDNKKSFLQNSQTSEIIKTKEKIRSIENLGSRFLMAKFYPTDNEFKKPAPAKPAPKGKDTKTGDIEAPEMIVVEPLKDFSMNAYVFYSKNLPLEAVLKIEAQTYMKLYEKEAENKDGGQLTKESNYSDFDYLVFKKDKQLFLYDKKLKLLKEMAYPKTEEGSEIDKKIVIAAASKFLGKQVDDFPSILPDMAEDPSSLDEEKNDAFEVKTTTDGQYQLIRRSDEKVCFTTPFKMEYYDENNRVWFENKSKESSGFSIDKETGIPYLPKKYVDLLKIKIEN